MNREDVIQLAREASKQEPREDWNSTAWVFGDEALEHFAKAVEQRTLERAAQEFDRRSTYLDGTPSSGWYEPNEPAEIIRALGEKA